MSSSIDSPHHHHHRCCYFETRAHSLARPRQPVPVAFVLSLLSTGITECIMGAGDLKSGSQDCLASTGHSVAYVTTETQDDLRQEVDEYLF